MGMSEFEEAWEDEERLRSSILNGPIRELAPRAPVCVGPHATLSEAVAAMNSVKAGCVLVTDLGRLLGILTERDILRHVVGKLDLDTAVSEVMTRDPESVRPDDGIAHALHKMHLGGYRHVPVVDEQGTPVGVVSVRDFVRFIVSLFPADVLNIPPDPDLGIARSPEGA